MFIHSRVRDQRSAESDVLSSVPVRQKPIVPNSDEALGQDVKKKSAKDLGTREIHDPVLIPVRVVLVAERDAGFVDTKEPLVGNGDAMGVSSKVLHNRLRSQEGRLRIHDPLLLPQPPEKTSEGVALREVLVRTMKRQRCRSERCFETVDKLCAKELREDPLWDKIVAATWDPMRSIWREPPSGNDEVDVRVQLEFLSPGVKHPKEPDLGTERMREGRSLEESGGRALHEKIVEQFPVSKNKRSELVRDCAHHVEIGPRKQILLPSPKPLGA